MATTTTTSTKDCCVCISSLLCTVNPKLPPTDVFTIVVTISDAYVPYDPSGKNLRRTDANWARQKSVFHSRNNFCSMSESEQREFILKMIQDEEIPFPLENIHWGRSFPTEDQETAGMMSMDQAVSRILDTARTSAGQQGKGKMMIDIMKLEKLAFEVKYMEDWLAESKCDVQRYTYMKGEQSLFYMKLVRKDFFGLKPVMMKEPCSCSICLTDMREGKLAVQMPCSHIFHGFCILEWFNRRPTCPLCRNDMFGPLFDTYIKTLQKWCPGFLNRPCLA